MNTKVCQMWAGFLLAVVMLAGCGKGEPKAQAKSFDSAPPEIKALWDAAVAADKANDYFTAVTAYGKIIERQSTISQEQFDTVAVTSKACVERMRMAAEGGDAAAKNAMAKIMAPQFQR